MAEVPTAVHVEDLFEQVRLLFHQAAQMIEELHSAEPVTAGMRAVLEWLRRHGPATVPQIARSRFVTRQHIQILVNALAERDLVATDQNPAHQRSSLVRLTAEGQRLIRRMMRRERQYLATIDLPISQADIIQATQVLAAVRAAIGVPT
jgi:DNA-binding MarR family transcriptional regulator